MHASITRRFNLGNYQSKDITIGISQVPLHATDAMIADMLTTGGRIVEAIDRQIEHELGPRNPAAFVEPDGKPDDPNPEPARVEAPVASGRAHSWETPEPAARIPDESEVNLNTVHIYGVDVVIPPAGWLIEKVEATDPTGGQSKTMRHMNAALTSAGFAEGDRHWASLALIQAAFGGMARTELKSLKDLTKGEAHVVTSYFMEAGEAEIGELRRATSALKGQLVIGEQYCDQHPFCEHKWQGKGCFAAEAVLV